MVRSMYSGVAGLRTHQARMDVIGNNIANVNTYGFKGSRVAFRDVYYQTMSGASAATSSRGGTNPSQIGNGTKIGGVEVLHTRSSFAMTDNGMDLAIAGEGFIQVQDTDGNTFYTRAGLLNVDSAGNLVDQNGNFVLGVSGNPLGRAPSSERIQISVPSVQPMAGYSNEQINGKQFSFQASANSTDSNLTFNFENSTILPGGQKCTAEITTSGITIKLNATETFSSLAELSDYVNQAITEANGGIPHPGGTFTIDSPDAAILFATPLTGAQICSKDFSTVLGTAEGFPAAGTGIFAGMKFNKVSSNFTGAGSAVPTTTYNDPGAPAQAYFETSIQLNGKTYTGRVTDKMLGSGSFLLKDATNEYIELTHSGYTNMMNKLTAATGGTPPADGDDWDGIMAAATPPQAATPSLTFTASVASKNIGLSSKPVQLKEGTKGGAQTVADLTSISIGPDGMIEAMHPNLGRLQLGRIDLATFENPQGLLQSGSTYFAESANSGVARAAIAGSSGSGALAAGSLEMSNVDLSREFSDMIVTQRGFQANSKIITVSDEMLAELVNLKR